MKTCEKCGSQFKVRQLIDGKVRNFSARKYCLKCSPFNQHNTRQRHLHSDDKNGCRTCVKCGQLKKLTQFYIRNKSRAFSCSKCRGAKERQKVRERKQFYVDYKGGQCSKCGYNTCIGALEFHHRNPEKKDFKISDKLKGNKNKKDMLKELDKCDLLCSNCHREIHWDL